MSQKLDLTSLLPRIVVFGVGGAGGNAVDNMIRENLAGVEFIVANTDAQSLLRASCETKIQLGLTLTEGLGAGAKPQIGAAAAEETAAEIMQHIESAHMIFVAAGMGGGTGTGAAPVIARLARERGVLTIGVVTKPFQFEGRKRMEVAEAGIQELRKYVDTLIIIPNQNLFKITGEDTTVVQAFQKADEVLYSGVRGITDLMVRPGVINLDFADVRTVMSEMGAAMMGTGEASGPKRAMEAAQRAIANPLLDQVSLKGARAVLVNITGGVNVKLFEIDEIVNLVRTDVDPDALIIFGSAIDPEMNESIRVSVVATGLEEVYALDVAMGQRERAARHGQDQMRRPEASAPPPRPQPQPAPMPSSPSPAPSAASDFGVRRSGPSFFGGRREPDPPRASIPSSPPPRSNASPTGLEDGFDDDFDAKDLEIPSFLRRPT